MSQNLLPFLWTELKRYKYSWYTLRLVLLRKAKLNSFRNSNGIIFLSNHAKRSVLKIAGSLTCRTTLIPHGVDSRFFLKPILHRKVEDCTEVNPLRIIYVSIIDVYKHQWQLVKAVAKLRQETGWPLALDLIGPAYSPALKRLRNNLTRYD